VQGAHLAGQHGGAEPPEVSPDDDGVGPAPKRDHPAACRRSPKVALSASNATFGESPTGQLDYREWTTDDVRHSMHQIIARRVDFLGTPPKDAPAPDALAGEDYGDEPF